MLHIDMMCQLVTLVLILSSALMVPASRRASAMEISSDGCGVVRERSLGWNEAKSDGIRPGSPITGR